MPTVLGSQALTLRDTAEAARKRDGSLKANILDLVSEVNGVMDDATFTRADNGDKLSSDFLNKIPHGTWVALDEGVAASKTGFSVAWDACGRIKNRVQIGAELYERTKDKEALVQRHVRAISSGMKEDVADAFFYGNIREEPKKFNGLATFYDKFGAATTPRSNYAHTVISAGKGSSGAASSTSQLRSIWLVGWGDMGVTGFYPETSNTAGLTAKPMEKMQINDAAGNPTWAWTQELIWEVGLAIRDYRKAGRICNFQLDTALAAGYEDSLITHLRHLKARVKSDGVKQAFYMDEPTWEVVEDTMAHLTQSNAIKYADALQQQPMTFWGIPVRLCDCLAVNEAEVSALS